MDSHIYEYPYAQALRLEIRRDMIEAFGFNSEEEMMRSCENIAAKPPDEPWISVWNARKLVEEAINHRKK
jgi:hypothetical protein